MRIGYKTIYILAAVSTALVLASVEVNPVNAAFDPNNIIDNAIFDNSQTMSANDIQNFLNGFPNSCLKNYTAPYPIGYSEYGDNVSASTVIRRSADLWGINPQVILTTLEKEQSLVSGGAGCASWQYNSAMGMGCPDTGACPAPAYAGFSRQVTKGSWQLMFNRQRSEGRTGWNDDGITPYYSFMTAGYRARVQGGSSVYYDGYTTIDGSQVYLSAGATASLYSYTPHFHGNQNFVIIFERWFGTTHGTFLLQSPSSPAIFLQSGTIRYGVPSYDVLRAYGFDTIKVTPVSDQYMQSLTDGGTLSTTFKKEGEDAVYLADNGYRFGFSTYSQCVNWGFSNCLSASSKPLSPYIFNMIRNAGDMKDVMLHGSSVYLMDNGKKRLLLSTKAMNENGYFTYVPITNTLNLQQPPGFAIPENNSFITFGSSSVIYIYANGLFYPINSYDLFHSIVPSGYPVFTDNYSLYNSQPPAVQKAVSPFMRITSSGKTYLFGNGNKYDISADPTDWPSATSFDEIAPIINSRPTTAVIGSNSTYQTPAGLLFRVSQKSILPFYSLADYFTSSYAKQPLVLPAELLAGLSTGSPVITPGGGSLYKVTTSGKQDAIYLLNSDGTSCRVNSVEQLGEFAFNTSNVQRIGESMASGGTLKGLIRNSSGVFIINQGTKTAISSASLSLWGMNQIGLCGFTNEFTNSLPSVQSNKDMRFARLPNGAIYYAYGGQSHLLRSYASFLGLGGNSLNTVDVSLDFTTYVTSGDPFN